MAIAITVPSQVEVGETITFSGTGFTDSGEVDVRAYSEDGNGGLEVGKVKLAASSGGAIADTAGTFEIIAQEEGHVVLEITDVTAVDTVTERIEVFHVD